MGTKRDKAVPTELATIVDRIGRWRQERSQRSPMPEELWRDAAAQARRLGVSLVARVLGLGHNALKQRAGTMRGNAAAPATGDFVELKGMGVVGGTHPAGTAVVELSGRDGATLTVRLPASAALEVATVASALWKARA